MTAQRAAAPPAHHTSQSLLLASLPAADFELIAADLELVPMRLGDSLYEPGQPLRHAYFPTTSVVSLHYVTSTGASIQTAGVGREGIVGIALFMGGDTSPSSAVVQTGGHGYRLERRALLLAFERPGPFQRSLLRYTQALITQIAQTSVCYRHHSVEQQLSCWLLATADRLPAGELVMTQELVSSLLGVRRESITEAAGRLRDAGHISYRRGHISILNRAGLQSSACECYDVVRKEFIRLLPPLKEAQEAQPAGVAWPPARSLASH